MSKRKKHNKPASYKQRNTLNALPVGGAELHVHDAPTHQDKAKQSEKEKNAMKNPIEVLARWWNHLGESQNSNRVVAIFTFVIAITGAIYAVFAGLQWETMKDAVQTARDANKLTEDSVRARIVIPTSEGWDFVHPVTAGERIVIKGKFKNIGHSPAVYGIVVAARRWRGMPDTNDTPVHVNDVSVPLEPDIPTDEFIPDITPATQAFIDGIPDIHDLNQDPINNRLAPSTTKETLFFMGQLTYDSLGKRREKQFCFFMVRNGPTFKEIGAYPPPTDPRYILMNCPKWNASKED